MNRWKQRNKWQSIRHLCRASSRHMIETNLSSETYRTSPSDISRPFVIGSNIDRMIWRNKRKKGKAEKFYFFQFRLVMLLSQSYPFICLLFFSLTLSLALSFSCPLFLLLVLYLSLPCTNLWISELFTLFSKLKTLFP